MRLVSHTSSGRSECYLRNAQTFPCGLQTAARAQAVVDAQRSIHGFHTGGRYQPQTYEDHMLNRDVYSGNPFRQYEAAATAAAAKQADDILRRGPYDYRY